MNLQPSERERLMGMMPPRSIAHDISYASSAGSWGSRALVRLMENATGRLGLIKRVRGYEKEVAAGRDFFDVMAERYGLTLNVAAGCLSHIPREGPLILIANHPYGILDGLMMGYILARTRGDFRLLANSVFLKAEDLNRVVLPISFEDTTDARALNIETRKTAVGYLAQGGAIGIFPGGTVSTAIRPFARPMDPAWRGFTARMIGKSRATVVPVFFDGHTSRIFQIASHMHLTLRLGLLINEFGKRVDTPVTVSIGQPISRDTLDPLAKDSKAMMDFLRKATYDLSTDPEKSFDPGYEFEARHR
jgi:putative hemolysin